MKLLGTFLLIGVFLSCESGGSSKSVVPTNKNRLIVAGDTIDNNQEKKEKCIELNDSALVLFLNRNKVEEAITVIDLAIECDSQNMNFVRNKLVILANGEHYDECLKYVEKKKDVVGTLEYYTTKADCNYYLKNMDEFEHFSKLALKEVESNFNQNKDVSNLILILSVVKRYKGEVEANTILEDNRSILDEGEPKGLYDVAVSMLEKAPKITDTISSPYQVKSKKQDEFQIVK